MRLHFILLLLVSSCTMAQKLQPMSYYQSNPKISKTAKNFFKKLPQYQKNTSIYYNDNNMEMTTASIHDSVLTNNKQTRPFYLYLMNRNMDIADGSLLLGSMISQFKIIQNKPAYFFRYMLDNPNEKKKYFAKWANNMNSFYDQYCESFLDMNPDTCLPVWGRGVMALLAGENASIKGLAKDYFKLMKIPLEEPPPFDDSLHSDDSVTIKIGELDNGKTFRVVIGTKIEALFRECRGCASIWRVTTIDSKKIQLINEVKNNPSCTNCVGGSQDHIFYLKVIDKGNSTLSFTYFSQKITVYIFVE